MWNLIPVKSNVSITDIDFKLYSIFTFVGVQESLLLQVVSVFEFNESLQTYEAISLLSKKIYTIDYCKNDLSINIYDDNEDLVCTAYDSIIIYEFKDLGHANEIKQDETDIFNFTIPVGYSVQNTQPVLYKVNSVYQYLETFGYLKVPISYNYEIYLLNENTSQYSILSKATDTIICDIGNLKIKLVEKEISTGMGSLDNR